MTGHYDSKVLTHSILASDSESMMVTHSVKRSNTHLEVIQEAVKSEGYQVRASGLFIYKLIQIVSYLSTQENILSYVVVMNLPQN